MKRIPFLLFVLFVMLFVNLRAQSPHWEEYDYPVVQEEQPLIRGLINQVSVDSLTATIEHLQSYHTRRWNSRMVYQVQDWLYEQYRDMGYDSVFLHDFPVVYHDTLYETSDNVIALKKGLRYPDEYVVCGAHYDSYNKFAGHPDSLRAPGADDNASGTAGILETARILCRCTFERSVLFCGFAAEEIGLYGSAAFAKDCADQGMHIVGYFNLDMIGYLEEGSDLCVYLIYVSQDSTFADYVTSFSHTYYPDMPIRRSWYQSGSDSDFSSFNRNGYAAIHLFENPRHSSPFIHTPDDLLGLSVNNMDQAERFTELHLGLVATLAGLVSNGVEELDMPGLCVAPNPVDGPLRISGPAIEQLSVFNLLGQEVYSRPCAGRESVDLSLEGWVSGLYFIRVKASDGRIHTAKFIKR